MRLINIKMLVIASAAAMVLLILFQVKWMLHSKDLIEEQFNQKVNMALCSAIEEAGKKCSVPGMQELCNQISEQKPILQQQWLEQLGIHDALSSSMSFYDIDLSYKTSIVDKNTANSSDSLYSCSMQPIDEGDFFLGVSFSDRQEYVIEQMGFMAGTSILLLLFVCGAFAVTLRALIRQKRLNDINISFFSNMSHEYRTPLTNIRLALRMMQRKHGELGNNQFYQIIGKESKRLGEQVERVLQLAKMENGEYQLSLQEIDLRELIEEVVEEMQLLITSKNARVSLDLGESSIWVTADRFHLSNVFRNLIDNALKYCETQPLIRIRMEEKGHGVKLCFEDNGIGICKADQNLVFEKFQRVGTGDLHKQKGFGLGLSYVKMVIELHHGLIKVFSELNKGSQFTLFLPAKY